MVVKKGKEVSREREVTLLLKIIKSRNLAK